MELAALGFIPLVHCKGTDYCAFFSMPTCQKQKAYNENLASAGARLECQTQYVLTTSRFAHAIKAMMRDRVGRIASRNECEVFLNKWISQYVLTGEDADLLQQARYPLREGKIDVAEVPLKPGAYRAVCFLRPHFQLDELSVSLRLVVEIPPPAGS